MKRFSMAVYRPTGASFFRRAHAQYAIRGGIAVCVAITLSAAALAVPWPLDNTGQVHNIWHSYGQWQEAGGIHLHEGIDLPAAEGTDVKAVAKGKIVNIYVDATSDYGNYITISDDGNASKGWGYVHVKAKAGLAVGDTVNAGDVIGTITKTATLAAHLHFERDSDKNGGWPNAGGGIEHLDDDPLLYLNPATDNTFPTIDDIKYRRAEDEGNDANPQYCTTKDCNNYTIIGSRAPTGASGNVDVLPSAYDKFNSYADKLSVQNIKFHALGRLGDVTPFTLQLVNFQGNGANDFAQQENNNFSNLFRDNTLRFAQAIYENDSVANSADEGPFWYIVTNQDDDQITERTDDEWFWDTDGIKTEAWNDKAADDERAANNAKDKFRDDYYDVYINTRDEANNVTSKVERVLLDNWEQTVAADKFFYWLGETVFEAGGAQHQESDPSIPLFVVDTVVDCGLIPSLGIEGAAVTTSDGNGNLAAPVPVWVANKVGYFNLITDYDDDGVWHSRLDADDPLVVLAHKYFHIQVPRITTGPPYPSSAIQINVTTTPVATPIIERVRTSIRQATALAGPNPPAIALTATEGGGAPTGSAATSVDFGVSLQSPVQVGLHLEQHFDILDASNAPGTLVDLGIGSFFDIVFTPTTFQVHYELLIPSFGPQFWFLTGTINPEQIGIVSFLGVNAFTSGAMFSDSVFNLFLDLQIAPNATAIGNLFTINMMSGYVPEPGTLCLVSTLWSVVMLKRRVKRVRLRASASRLMCQPAGTV
jgi:hypothetical protein